MACRPQGHITIQEMRTVRENENQPLETDDRRFADLVLTWNRLREGENMRAPACSAFPQSPLGNLWINNWWHIPTTMILIYSLSVPRKWFVMLLAPLSNQVLRWPIEGKLNKKQLCIPDWRTWWRHTPARSQGEFSLSRHSEDDPAILHKYTDND